MSNKHFVHNTAFGTGTTFPCALMADSRRDKEYESVFWLSSYGFSLKGPVHVAIYDK
jgi:hypothetical protein